MLVFNFLVAALAVLGSTGAFAGSSSSDPASTSQPFLWGVANSAFQVEGSPADSDMYRWSHTPGAIKDGTNADVATDFWNRYDEDFALAQGLGANAFRMSLAWERLEPSRGEWNEEAFEHYEKIILDMRARGLEPVITIWHSVLPTWVSEAGGVLAESFADDFSDYAAHVVDRLARGETKVRYWLTVNEPTTYAEGVFIDGAMPGNKGGDYLNFLKAIDQQAEAHNEAFSKIHALDGLQNVQVGYAQDLEDFQPKHWWNPMDDIATFFADATYNKAFLDQVTSSLDFLGVNYYNRNMVSFTFNGFVAVSPGEGPLSDVGQEVYPEGMEHVLQTAAGYGVPILITENGVADSDDHLRAKFLKEHIRYLLKARDDDGIPVIGYLHWSLTDNFEWTWGSSVRYGLVEIDYSTLARKPRPSYYVYRDLISAAPLPASR